MRLKIAVLIPVKSGTSGGFVRHLSEVLPRWVSDGGRVGSITIYAPDSLGGEMERIGLTCQAVPAADYRRGFQRMSVLVNASDADVVLNTTSRPVKVAGKPLVTIVQNIEPVQRASYPMSLAWRLRLWRLRWETARSCRQSSRVIAVSHTLKDELQRRFRLKDVDVVYHGFKAEPQVARPDRAPPERFIFTAGSIVPYRGYEDVILAIAQLRRSGGPVLPVLVAGTATALSRSYESRLRRLAVRHGVAKDIHWLGQLSAAEMAWCYQHATVFVQTSRAESFSNIQVEAMGNGAVIVSCNQPPMPEILGDAVIYYPTGNARALADALRRVVMMEQAEVERWKSAARQRAARFSWDQTASQTLAVLEAAVVGHDRG